MLEVTIKKIIGDYQIINVKHSNDKISFYINDILNKYGDFICDKNIMKSNGETIDMKKEIWLTC